MEKTDTHCEKIWLLLGIIAFHTVFKRLDSFHFEFLELKERNFQTHALTLTLTVALETYLQKR